MALIETECSSVRLMMMGLVMKVFVIKDKANILMLHFQDVKSHTE